MTSFGSSIIGVATWFIGGLVVSSAALKARRPRPFRQFIVALGGPASPIIVWLVVTAEFLVGGGLLGLAGRLPPIAGALMFGLFLAAVRRHVQRTGSTSVACGCFGSGEELRVDRHVWGLLTGIIVLLASAAISDRPSLIAELGRLSAAQAAVVASLLLLSLAEFFAVVGANGSGRNPVRRSRHTSQLPNGGAV